MKIYSSDLLQGSQVDQGNLEITTGDDLIIADANTAGASGLIITDGAANVLPAASSGELTWLSTSTINVLGATGQELAISDYMVQFAELDNTTLRLYASHDNTGNEVLNVDLSSLASAGGGGGAFNETVGDVPVKFVDAFQDEDFIDSVISEDITTSGTASFFEQTGQTITAAASKWDISVSSGADQSAFDAVYSSGQATRVRHLIGGATTGQRYDVTVTRVGSLIEITPASTVILPAVATADTIQLIRAEQTRTVEGVTIDGHLTVTGTTTTINSTQLEVEDAFITLGDPASSTGGVTLRDTGILAVASQTAGSPATKNHVGIRYNVDGGTGGRWEVANTPGVTLDSNNVPSDDSEWSPISVIGKFAATFDAAGAATSGDNTIFTFTHGLVDDSLSITVYETDSSSNILQIIPGELQVNSTQIIITMPTAEVGTPADFKVVAVG